MWREIIISLLIFWVPEATLKQVCGYHDVVEYLNISSKKELLLYTMPKKNWESPFEVGLDFTLVSILSVIWTNEFLSWNPLDFCNISSISLPAKLFWVPDIFIDERADDDKFTPSPFVNILSTGRTYFLQSYRLTSSCNLDVHAFPFDKQKCNLTLTASVYQGNSDEHSYISSICCGLWLLPVMHITMTRRSILFVLVLIVPTFVLFLVDMAISYAFATPGEKIAFKITLILEVSFLSLILNDMLPATSDEPPVIAMFFSGMFLFMILGIMENAFVLYLREKKANLLPLAAFLNRFKKKEKKESEDPVIYLGKH
ncbi:hypothetical protein JD844_011557 [Phrynosoma platyrhinos]|uniref:5-hydroxytryptamine receptor 3A n=1 Tax=Phrynosoma platyrhinos TaxID=52577 RepID=A0ABQ7TI76_PHRPL|nr:hypothetical protein JD844_011557 [Phrynosoma platyrhinos]